jgi:hypothetical protein
MQQTRLAAGLLLAGLLMPATGRCQNQPAEASTFGISFSGFVKADYTYDTRQTVAAREGHFLLYPAAPADDPQGEDVNAAANLNIYTVQTRLQGKITAPDALGAKTSGLIEAEFFGSSDADVNGFRLRHAFLKLEWAKTSLLLGQYWHPMFVTEAFPQTVSFNTGAPFQPFSRNPQLRLTRALGSLNLILAAAAQRDFTSPGPAGFSSSYLRNAAVPDLHAQLQLKKGGHVFGLATDWKKLVPQIRTSKGLKTSESVTSLAGMGYAKLTLAPVTMTAQAVYGENLPDLLMLGGYGVLSSDPVTGYETYSPTRSFTTWTDVDRMYRISPRLVWNSGKVRLAAEVEYSAAAYGKTTTRGEVEDAETVANTRVLLAAYLFF